MITSLVILYVISALALPVCGIFYDEYWKEPYDFEGWLYIALIPVVNTLVVIVMAMDVYYFVKDTKDGQS